MSRELLSQEQAFGAISGSNPFIDSLGPKIIYGELAGKMEYFPLRGMPLNLSLDQREDLLALQKQHFVSTTMSQNIAASMQTMLREHYITRNPKNPAVRKQIMEIAKLRDAEPSKIPWLTNFASGSLIQGITGQGKTTIWMRYLALLPAQVRIYANGEIPGYLAITQIVWMKVDMSADGSRGGFLLSILAEVDRLIGSDYHDQYSISRLSIEKLMVRVGIILSTHFCGMLIVEEIQENNFSKSIHMDELTTFFLRLLNFGIPVVLVGNPLGFTELESRSQVMRRLTSGGNFRLDPAPRQTDFNWKNCLVPGVWTFNVMPTPTPLTDPIRATLYEYSGGIPDFLARLLVESQRIALRLGKDAVSVAHIEKAFKGPTMIDSHALITGFATKNISLISRFDDIPFDYYARLWSEPDKKYRTETTRQDPDTGIVDDNSKVDGKLAQAKPAKTASVIQKAAQFKSQQTRAGNREKTVKKLNATLAKEDMRMDGAKASLIARIEEVKKEIG